MPDLDTDLIDFIRPIAPVHIYEIAGELHSLSQNGAKWPRASAEHWKREIERLVKDGKLDETKGMITIAKAKANAPTQGTLFD